MVRGMETLAENRVPVGLLWIRLPNRLGRCLVQDVVMVPVQNSDGELFWWKLYRKDGEHCH